jgi:acyl carrier protein
MTEAEIQERVLSALRGVAPELASQTPDLDAELRDELDLDSMDMLNFATALHKSFGIDVPERDYARINTLRACATYVAAALTAQPARAQT